MDLQIGGEKKSPGRIKWLLGDTRPPLASRPVPSLSALPCRRGGFTQGPNHSQVAPSAAVQGGFAGQERGHRATEPRFARRY